MAYTYKNNPNNRIYKSAGRRKPQIGSRMRCKPYGKRSRQGLYDDSNDQIKQHDNWSGDYA